MTIAKKMKLIYFFRAKSGGISIERLFDDIANTVSKEHPVQRWHCPFLGGKNLWNVLRNGLAARRVQDGSINHITGDVHYLAIFLEPSRTLLTVHDLNLLVNTSGLKRWILKLIWFDLPLRRVRVVTTISTFTREALLQTCRVPSDQVFVVPDCISDFFQPNPRPFNGECPLILHIGTKENKNLMRLAQALKGIRCKLRIVGTPNESQQSALQANSVDYEATGLISDEQLLKEYQGSDFLCFVSTYEGFGMPIVEAQAVGRPVVTSNVTSMPEVAGDSACLVDPFCVASIRDGILKVIQDSEYRNNLISWGFKNVERYRLKSVAAQYEKIYKERIV